MLILPFLLAALMQAPPSATPQGSSQNAIPIPAPEERFQGIKVVRVASEVKELEQGSLDPNGNVSTLIGGPSRPGGRILDDPSEVPAMGGAFSGMAPNIRDGKADVPNAATLYLFDLQPGEQLNVKMQGKDRDRLTMRFLQRTRNDRMTPSIRRANMTPTPVRSSRIAMANTMKEPYQAMLLIVGQANYPFKLVIGRSK